MQPDMQMHLDLTLAEASAQLKGDAPGSIAGYDKVVEHILGFSDMLSQGIIKQFPNDISGAI